MWAGFRKSVGVSAVPSPPPCPHPFLAGWPKGEDRNLELWQRASWQALRLICGPRLWPHDCLLRTRPCRRPQAQVSLLVQFGQVKIQDCCLPEGHQLIFLLLHVVCNRHKAVSLPPAVEEHVNCFCLLC